MAKRNSNGQFIKGSRPEARLDLTGKKFNRLTVVKFAYMKNERTHWKCLCDCGNETIIQGTKLISGHTKSCGCLKTNFPGAYKHGMRNTRFYKCWAGMKYRCYNTNDIRNKMWAGRGITVCNKWLKFTNFRDDMLTNYNKHCKKYGEKNTTLDRYPDKNGNYCPENTRYATPKEQANNTRKNKFYTFQEKTMNLEQWSKQTNISVKRLETRMRRGWSIEKSFTTPIKQINFVNKQAN